MDSRGEGCLAMLIAIFVIVLFGVLSVISDLKNKSNCYDLQTKYGYSTQYLNDKCYMSMDGGWVETKNGYLKFEDIKGYLPDAK